MSFIARFGRTLLLSAAVVAVGLYGCGGGNPSGGDDNGVGIVGDWMAYSWSDEGGETRYDGDNKYREILSFRASGECERIEFKKIGNVWAEGSEIVCTYRVRGSMIYFKYPDGGEDEGAQYRVSGDYFTIKLCYEYGEGDCHEQTYKRVNIAEVRRSLGTVYTNDPKLYTSTAYNDLSWYSQDSENEQIEFSGVWVYGDGLDRYIDYYSSDQIGYYTTGNKLILVSENCDDRDWDDDYYHLVHCSVSEKVELTYKITGSGRNMQLSINGDIWLSAEGRDYDYSPSPSRQTKRQTVYNSGKSIFSPPSSRVFGDSRQ